MSNPDKTQREEAFRIFKETGGIIANCDLARMLDVPEKTISAWKCRDKWTESIEPVEASFENDERSMKKKELINALTELGTYSTALDFLIEMYLDAYEDYKMTRSDKIRRETVRYLAQLGLDAKGLKKKKTVDVDKEKEIDAAQTDNKLLQFRQRKVNT